MKEAIWRGLLASDERLLAELRQSFDDFLLAVDYLAEEGDAVDVAVLVPGRLHQNAWLIFRRDSRVMRGFRKGSAIKLSDFFCDVLDEIHRGIAFDAVVIAGIVEPRLEPRRKFLHGGNRRIDGKADMTAHAVGCLASKIDHLLAEQCRFADQRLVNTLLLCLAQETRAFFFIEIDEDRFSIGALEFDYVGREVSLAGFGRDVGDHLDVTRIHFLDEGIAATLAEIIVYPQHGDGRGLNAVADVVRYFRHAELFLYRGAEDVRISLLGNGRGLATDDLGNFRLLR